MKPWWQSRTLWFNALLAMATVFEANVALLRESLGPQAYLGALTLAAGVNAFLRLVTSQPIGEEGQS